MKIHEAAFRCKDEIGRAVEAALAKLKADTGVSPSSVQIQMVEITTIGAMVHDFVVGDVTLEFRL